MCWGFHHDNCSDAGVAQFISCYFLLTFLLRICASLTIFNEFDNFAYRSTHFGDSHPIRLSGYFGGGGERIRKYSAISQSSVPSEISTTVSTSPGRSSPHEPPVSTYNWLVFSWYEKPQGALACFFFSGMQRNAAKCSASGEQVSRNCFSIFLGHSWNIFRNSSKRFPRYSSEFPWKFFNYISHIHKIIPRTFHGNSSDVSTEALFVFNLICFWL